MNDQAEASGASSSEGGIASENSDDREFINDDPLTENENPSGHRQLDNADLDQHLSSQSKEKKKRKRKSRLTTTLSDSSSSDSENEQSPGQPAAKRVLSDTEEPWYKKFEFLLGFENEEEVAKLCQLSVEEQRRVVETNGKMLDDFWNIEGGNLNNFWQAAQRFSDTANIESLTVEKVQARQKEHGVILENYGLLVKVVMANSEEEVSIDNWLKSAERKQITDIRSTIHACADALLRVLHLGSVHPTVESEDKDLNSKQQLLVAIFELLARDGYKRWQGQVYRRKYVCCDHGPDCEEIACRNSNRLCFSFSWVAVGTIEETVMKYCDRQRSETLWKLYTINTDVKKYLFEMLSTTEDSQFCELQTHHTSVSGVDGVWFQRANDYFDLINAPTPKCFFQSDLFVKYKSQRYNILLSSAPRFNTRGFINTSFAIQGIDEGEYFDLANENSLDSDRMLDETRDDFEPLGAVPWLESVCSKLKTPHFDSIFFKQGYVDFKVDSSFPRCCDKCGVPETAAKCYRVNCKEGKHEFKSLLGKKICPECSGSGLSSATATCAKCSPVGRSLKIHKGNIECPSCGEFHPAYGKPHKNCNESPHHWWSLGLVDDEPLFICYALLGRMFYPVGEDDNFQVCPFFYGAAQSGKSLISAVLQMMLGNDNVGIIMSTMEKQFGLAPLLGKLAAICNELRSPCQIPLAALQSMITGERVTIAKKYCNPAEVEWKIPTFLIGNKIPEEFTNIRSCAAAITRRLVMVHFKHQIPSDKVDSQLIGKITGKAHGFPSEIGRLMRKVNANYRLLAWDTEGNHFSQKTTDAFSKRAKKKSMLFGEAESRLTDMMDSFARFFKKDRFLKLQGVIMPLNLARKNQDNGSVQYGYQQFCEIKGITTDTDFNPDKYEPVITSPDWGGSIASSKALELGKDLPFEMPADFVNGPAGATKNGPSVSVHWKRLYKAVFKQFKEERKANPKQWTNPENGSLRSCKLAAQSYCYRIKSISIISNKSSQNEQVVANICSLNTVEDESQRTVLDLVQEWCNDPLLPEFDRALMDMQDATMQQHVLNMQQGADLDNEQSDVDD